MKISKQYYGVIIIIIFLIVLVAGCTKSKSQQYKDFKNEFYKTYFEVADNISQKYMPDTIRDINSTQNNTKLQKMKQLLDGIKDNVPESKKESYEKLCNWYEGMKMISDANGKYDKFSVDEKRELGVELMVIIGRCCDWHDKDSGIVWE